MTELAELPTFDVADRDFLADRAGVLASFREKTWIAQSDRGYEVFPYDRCEEIMRDPRFLHGIGDTMAVLGVAGKVRPMPGRNLLFSEGVEHASLRRVVQPWFTPRRAEEMRKATRGLADNLVEEFSERGRGDALHDFTVRMPQVVFCWMIGAPVADAPQIAAWGEASIKIFKADPALLPEIRAAVGQLYRYVGALIEEKKQEPGDDLLSFLVAAAKEGQITDADVMALAVEALGASSDNTANAAAVMAGLLSRNPAQWRRLQAERAYIPRAVEECMRLEPRVRCAKKVASETIEIGGFRFPAGSRMWCHLESAHRDPAVYPDPDALDVARAPLKPQLNFGLGRHNCIGSNPARMEQQELLGAMLDRWDAIEPAGEFILQRDDGTQVEKMPISVRVH